MRATGEPGATRSLIGRSELVDWCLVVRRVRFACAMDNLCHVSTTRKTSRRRVRVRSCPANLGASLAPSETDPVTLGNGICYVVLDTFLKTGPPCRVCPCWCGASLAGAQCNVFNPTLRLSCGICLHTTSDDDQTRRHICTNNRQTPPPWWSCSPLQRHGFDEPMPPEGWAALRMFVSMSPSKRFNRFHKLK